MDSCHALREVRCRIEFGGLNEISPRWGLNPGPSVYKTDALPLSYRGCWTEVHARERSVHSIERIACVKDCLADGLQAWKQSGHIDVLT